MAGPGVVIFQPSALGSAVMRSWPPGEVMAGDCLVIGSFVLVQRHASIQLYMPLNFHWGWSLARSSSGVIDIDDMFAILARNPRKYRAAPDSAPARDRSGRQSRSSDVHFAFAARCRSCAASSFSVAGWEDGGSGVGAVGRRQVRRSTTAALSDSTSRNPGRHPESMARTSRQHAAGILRSRSA